MRVCYDTRWLFFCWLTIRVCIMPHQTFVERRLNESVALTPHLYSKYVRQFS